MKKTFLRIGLFAAIIIVAWLAWRVFADGSGEPVYQGKRLSYWLQGLDYARRDRLGIPTRDVNRAVHSAGTNSFPVLFRMLRSTDSPAKIRFMKLAGRQHLVAVNFNTAESKHRQAMVAFANLGPRSLAAIPELIKIYNDNHSESSQIEIIQIFGSMGTAAKDAIPLINRALSGTNANLKSAASNTVQMVSPSRNYYNPVNDSLLSRLNDYKTWQQTEGARMIYAEWFGSSSRYGEIIPVLVGLLKQNRPNSYWLTFALEHLDPAAAAPFMTNTVEIPEPSLTASNPRVLGNSHLLAVGHWTGPAQSGPINNLRARLLVYERPHFANRFGDWWGDAPVEIELQDFNYGINSTPTAVYFDDKEALQFELRDAQGKIIPPATNNNRTNAPPQWITVPFDGTVRFRADAATPATLTKPDGLTLRLAGNVWRISAGDTNTYTLSGTFTPSTNHANPLDYQVWAGTLPLPEVKFMVPKF